MAALEGLKELLCTVKCKSILEQGYAILQCKTPKLKLLKKNILHNGKRRMLETAKHDYDTLLK